jgi:hypothetical protein
MTMDDEMDREVETVRPSGEPAGAPAAEAYRAGSEPTGERRPPEEAEPTAAPARRAPSGAAADFDLLGNGELAGIRDRWAGLQAMFVDDPAGASRQADVMVGEMLDLMRQRHQELHETNEEADTEGLRVQFLRYRSFFQTLLG